MLLFLLSEYLSDIKVVQVARSLRFHFCYDSFYISLYRFSYFVF